MCAELQRLFGRFMVALVLACWAPVSVARAGVTEHAELELQRGEQRVIPSRDVRSYSEGVSGVVDVRLTREGNAFVVVGLNAGETSLLLMMKDGGELHYRITVTDPDRARTGAVTGAAPTGVSARENVRLDFYFVEVTTTSGHQIGVSWPGAVGGGLFSAELDVLAGGFTSATAVVADQVLPRLDLAQSEGWAKVLRRAAVITANGTEARFAGGGEVNVAIVGGFGGTLKQIEYGSVIGVLPRFDPETGRIELEIRANVSDLTPDNGTGIPGRSVSTLDTVVNLELNQSIVLAGLTSDSESAEHSGIPLLSQIPILGALFGSHRASQRQSEILIFIVPTVVDGINEQGRERIRQAMSHYLEYRGDIEPVRRFVDDTLYPAERAR